EVSFDGEALPFLELFLDVGAGSLRLQAEGMTAEVNLVGAARGFRDVELVSKRAKRIVAIERAREVGAVSEIVYGHRLGIIPRWARERGEEFYGVQAGQNVPPLEFGHDLIGPKK